MIEKGDKFNKLTAVKFSHRNKRSQQFWLFRCDCGSEKIICVSSVKNNSSKSCGCLQKEGLKERLTTHGMCKTKIYRSWAEMKRRCLNKNDTGYKDYGGRGITVCKEWLKFENFYDDMREMPKNKTLDRIDNNGDYFKKNCKWSTPKEQANNRRNSHFLTYKGKTQTIAQWAEELEINDKKLWSRIKGGWDTEKALTNQ